MIRKNLLTVFAVAVVLWSGVCFAEINIAADDQPASNTAAVATIANSKSYVIQGKQVHWSYDGTPTGGKLTIKSGSTVIDEVNITAAGPGSLSLDGFNSVVNETLSATLAAGGVGVSGKVSISGRYK